MVEVYHSHCRVHYSFLLHSDISGTSSTLLSGQIVGINDRSRSFLETLQAASRLPCFGAAQSCQSSESLLDVSLGERGFRTSGLMIEKGIAKPGHNLPDVEWGI